MRNRGDPDGTVECSNIVNCVYVRLGGGDVITTGIEVSEKYSI